MTRPAPKDQGSVGGRGRGRGRGRDKRRREEEKKREYESRKEMEDVKGKWVIDRHGSMAQEDSAMAGR